MRFLLDASLSPKLGAGLAAAGHDAIHVANLGMASADDGQVMDLAQRESRILLAADSDFGKLLLMSGAMVPSVILFRRPHHEGSMQLAILLSNLERLEADLAAGAFITIRAGRIRVRKLPLRS
ncbi:MAG: DUF5615 family PIN-like protein [Candidatus Sericytochromatia bacterium]|nr:DUF5615 family PIN-like protein [Candidatus Tanganyikabacteria bacterium]